VLSIKLFSPGVLSASLSSSRSTDKMELLCFGLIALLSRPIALLVDNFLDKSPRGVTAPELYAVFYRKMYY
jgi:hypothetical protein